MKEKERDTIDMTKGFDQAVGKPDPKKAAEDKAEKDKAEATNLVAYFTNVLSTGQINVRVLKPRRKEAFAHSGMIIGIRADFQTQAIWCTVAYGAGIDKKINGKKQFVPYSDSYRIDDLEPISIYHPEQDANAQAKES